MLVGLKYVGHKDSYTDHLYGTGITWEGEDVHAIDGQIAAKMLQHTDVWAAAKLPKDAKPSVTAAAKPGEELLDTPPNLNINSLTKPQLVEYAMRSHGKALDPAASIQALRKEVKDLRTVQTMQGA